MKSLKIIMSLMWSLILIQYSEALKKGIKNKLYSRCLDLDDLFKMCNQFISFYFPLNA